MINSLQDSFDKTRFIIIVILNDPAFSIFLLTSVLSAKVCDNGNQMTIVQSLYWSQYQYSNKLSLAKEVKGSQNLVNQAPVYELWVKAKSKVNPRKARTRDVS